MLTQQLEDRVAVKWRVAGQHAVEGGAQSVDVGALVGLPECLFGRGEVGCPNEAAGRGKGRSSLPAGNAEVCELHPPVRGQEDVVGLDVAVNDAVRRGLFEGPGDVDGDTQSTDGLEPSPFEFLGDAGAVDELHDEEIGVFRDAEVLKSHGVG